MPAIQSFIVIIKLDLSHCSAFHDSAVPFLLLLLLFSAFLLCS